jgi:hypothetical protein
MKMRLSLLVLSAFLASFLIGCSGMSEEQAKNVDLKAAPKNPPKQGGAAGGEENPGPGTSAKPV